MRVKLLTQNMWINHVTFKTSTESKINRTNDFTAQIGQFDVVTLQEVFSHNYLTRVDYKELITSAAKKQGYEYVATGRPPSFMNQDSGLMILSKHPIVTSEFVSFSSYSWADMIVDKGFLYAKIKLHDQQNMHVVTTHMDAHASGVRENQVKQISQYIREHLEDDLKNELCIITGDWNIAAPSEEYRSMLQNFPDFQNIYQAGPYPATHQYGSCIDHVLVNKLECLEPMNDESSLYNIVNLVGEGDRSEIAISDHSGVAVQVNLQ